MDTVKHAIQLMEDNKASEALEHLESILPTANAEERFSIAELYIDWGYVQKAEEILLQLQKEFPDETDITLLLADIYIELENDDQAIYLLNQIEETNEAYIQALMQLADLYQAQGFYEVAEQKLLTAKQLQPNEPIIDFALGELLFSSGDYKKAIIHYQNVLPTSDIAEISIYERLGEAYAEVGEYEQALQCYGEVANKNSDTLFKYGFTAYQANRLDIAMKAWENVLEADPYYHVTYYYLAKAYMEEEMIEEAYQTVRKGLEFDEFNKELYYLSGVLAHKRGYDDESEKYIREAISLDPDYKEAIHFLIERLKEADKHSSIIELLMELKNIGSYDGLYEWELARAHNEMESFQNALKHYQEAYNMLYDDSDFLKEYAYFLTEEGDMPTAIKVFETYLNHEPEDTETEEFLSRLNQEQ